MISHLIMQNLHDRETDIHKISQKRIVRHLVNVIHNTQSLFLWRWRLCRISMKLYFHDWHHCNHHHFQDFCYLQRYLQFKCLNCPRLPKTSQAKYHKRWQSVGAKMIHNRYVYEDEVKVFNIQKCFEIAITKLQCLHKLSSAKKKKGICYAFHGEAHHKYPILYGVGTQSLCPWMKSMYAIFQNVLKRQS